jgi:hypothetical protein
VRLAERIRLAIGRIAGRADDDLVDDWPFDQAPNVVSITVTSILRGSPILYVFHDEDGGWQFLDGAEHTVADGALIGMGTALGLDATLREVADLPVGWVASRQEVGSRWLREPHPDE